jgi:hypothetical protein
MKRNRDEMRGWSMRKAKRKREEEEELSEVESFMKKQRVEKISQPRLSKKRPVEDLNDMFVKRVKVVEAEPEISLEQKQSTMIQKLVALVKAKNAAIDDLHTELHELQLLLMEYKARVSRIDSPSYSMHKLQTVY